jgi:GT2 family glycosyltransferase
MKTLIAVPCMDMLHTGFFVTYNQMRKVGDTGLAVCQSSLVYESRNILGKSALESGADRILWLDSDMLLPPDLMEKLSENLDNGCEYAAALYFQRNGTHDPVAYERLERAEDAEGMVSVDVATVRSWPEDQLFEIAGSGFGAVMMTVGLYRRVYEAYGLPFSPLLGLAEDLSFCLRARKLGAKLWCDSRVRPKHIGMTAFDERMYRRKETHED